MKTRSPRRREHPDTVRLLTAIILFLISSAAGVNAARWTSPVTVDAAGRLPAPFTRGYAWAGDFDTGWLISRCEMNPGVRRAMSELGAGARVVTDANGGIHAAVSLVDEKGRTGIHYRFKPARGDRDVWRDETYLAPPTPASAVLDHPRPELAGTVPRFEVEGCRFPALGVDNDGDLLLLYMVEVRSESGKTRRGLVSRFQPAGKDWGPPTAVAADVDPVPPGIAFDLTGAAHIVFSRRGSVWYARNPAPELAPGWEAELVSLSPSTANVAITIEHARRAFRIHILFRADHPRTGKQCIMYKYGPW